MSEQLKPCPFCGADGYPLQFNGMWKVECWRSDEGCGVDTAFFANKDRAIAAWNRRTKESGE